MNPFQRARSEAWVARERLQPGRAAEPLKASELVSRVESKIGLGLDSVAPSYPDLGGGSAVLMREQKFIYVSTKYPAGSDQYNGLVAHELGHYYLDSVQTAKTVADLQILFGSAGSPAVIKVEAYGARERQELQANVFGRELLLPRSVALALALAGNGPSKVAHDLGIPLDFAQQQMLDAMLLPEAHEEPTTLKSPSPDQLKAATATERFANVVAGPGTGKTTTLIHRVKYLVEEKKVDPSHILVLTFTNKAAFELVERLRAAGIERAADIWAGTFHAFGLEFMRKYHQHFGLKPVFGVADDLQSMVMLVSALPQIQLKHFLRVGDPYDWLGQVVKAISRLKEELLTPQKYREQLAKYPAEDSELQAKREDVATLFEAHTQLLAARNSVDFVDLISKPAMAITADRAPFGDLADKFQYILVDEYQDVTEAMVQLLRQLVHNEKHLWVVGDVRQAIHHWRGASLHSLLKFESAFKAQSSAGVKFGKYSLSINRRSSQEILEVVKQAGRIHALEDTLPLDNMTSSAGPTGERPVLMRCADREQVGYAIADQIQALEGKGVGLKDQAVLCRWGSDIEAVSALLHSKGIGVVHVGELGQAPEVKLLLCLMQLLVERQPRALVGLMGVPQLRMPLDDVRVLLHAAESSVLYQRGRWLQAPPPGLSKRAVEVMAALNQLLAGWSHSSNPWKFVCNLLLEHCFGLPPANDTSLEAAVTRVRLWQFAYAVRNGEGDVKESRLSRFLLRFRLRQKVGDPYGERELPPEASALAGVRLLTVHGSKGLEFEAVHVCKVSAEYYGLEKSSWVPPEDVRELVTPEMLGSSEQEYEHESSVERNNLLYVALSRAKRHLRMYFDAEFGYLAPQLLKPTHYKVEDYLWSSQAQPVTKPPPAFTAPDTIALSAFRSFSTCPLQYWYAEVLRLKRETEYESGVRAQWAIMEALKQVAMGSPKPPNEHFEEQWAKSKLLPQHLDPNLWTDAQYAFQRGLGKIAYLRQHGYYVEATSIVANQIIQLPWGFVVKGKYDTQFHVLLFSRRGKDLETVLKPVVYGLEVKGNKKLWLHSILSDQVDEAPSAKKPSMTKGYKAAVGLQEGVNAPHTGRHCGRCSYSTICPFAPTA
jgi:superfamily I DNA/RNA helicase/Zn-dependent peptidase ImmA (M78 family)